MKHTYLFNLIPDVTEAMTQMKSVALEYYLMFLVVVIQTY